MKKAVDNAPSYQSTSGGNSPATNTAGLSDQKGGGINSIGSSAVVGAAAGGGYQQQSQPKFQNGGVTMNVQDNLPMSATSSVGLNDSSSSTGGPGGPPATPGVPTGGDKTPLLQADLLKSLSGGVGFSHVNRPDGLSTFAGVFCPVATSMISVLYFLRLGFVVGQAGIVETLGQLALAYLIICFTVLSLCAVSTNGAIEGGGVYYMISRALGPEFGGAIGVLFFLANIFSGALSASGLSEVLVNNFGPNGSMGNFLLGGKWYLFMYAFFVSLFVLVICLVGATMFARTSIAVLVACGISYLSFLISFIVNNDTMQIKVGLKPGNSSDDMYEYANYTGIRQATFKENSWPHYDLDYTTGRQMDFALVFGIVFSGLTGLMAGANMSGELRQPNVSIPRGSLQAVFATFCVYVMSTFLVGASCSNKLLKNDYSYLESINMWPPLMLIGVFASQIVAAMSNLIGASRVLTRVGDDKLFGMLLYPTTRRVCGNNPVYSVIFSWFLILCVLLIGAMNTIAQITSIFFLLSYAGVNLACLALELTSAPNFRPQFQYFSWHTAFLGFIGCVSMMFVINPVSSGIAIILLLLLLIGLHYKAPMPHSWGSISQALIFHQVRKYLLMLDTRKEHVKFWRPQILLLVANPKSCLPLIDFVNDMKKSGLYVLGHVKAGDLSNSLMDPVQEDMPYWLSLVDYLRVKAFVELTVSNTIREGVQHLVRLSGIGAMKPNTIVLGFYDSTPPQNTFDRIVDRKPMKFAKIDRTEVVEYFTARDYNLDILQAPGLGSSSSNLRSVDAAANARRLKPDEYVKIIEDTLKMNKNVILARHFHKLDKDELFRRSGPKYVDVWPVDIIRPQNSSTTWDNSSLFLLQLACILNMVGKWRSKVTLRVFLCVTSLQDMQRKEFQLKEMLSQLRISAKSVLLPWDHVICHMNAAGPKTTTSTGNNGTPTSSVAVLPSNNKTPSHWVDVEAEDGKESSSSQTNSRESSTSPSSAFLSSSQSTDLIGLPKAYLQTFHDLLIRNSGQSAVVFLNMPLPPQDTSKYGEYLECLEMMTENMPPTLLVHGISSVISTAL